MSKDPRPVSVCLATCNGSKYLAELLQSIANQSVLPLEVVICDDRSSDDTIEIAEKFAASAPFPVLVHVNEERLGFAANFMAAASLCRGRIIAFCDQDDVWHSDKIATISRSFRDGVLMVYHNARVVGPDLSERGLLIADRRQEFASLEDDPFPFSHGFTQAFNRELLQFNDLWPVSCWQFDAPAEAPHDRWFIFLAALLGRVRYVDAALVNYRQHDDNTYGHVESRLWHRFSGFDSAAGVYERRAKVAANRAMLAERIMERVETDRREPISQAVGNYRALATRLLERSRAVSAPSITARLSGLWALCASGAYSGKSKWVFPPAGLPKDLVAGFAPGASRSASPRVRKS